MHVTRLFISRASQNVPAFAIGAALLASAAFFPYETHAASVEGTDWIEATSSASWTGRRTDTAMTVLNGTLWLLGGYNSSGGRLDDIWSSTDGSNWTQVGGTVPGTPRYGGAKLTFDNKLWVIGGSSETDAMNDVWSSTDGVTWTEATSTAEWPARNSFGAAVFDGEMWVMGGNYAGNINDVWSSTDGVTWTEATSTAEWPARNSFGVTVFNNKMWVMGGHGASGSLNDVWSSTDGVTWTEVTSSAPWSARESLVVTVYDNKMWVMGGYDNLGKTSDVWSSTDGVTWTEATDAADFGNREFASAQAFDGKLWVFGGQSDTAYLNDVWYTADLYDLSFDSQGGSSISTLANEESGASLTLPSAPTRSGYTFEEWNTAADGTGSAYAPGDAYTMGSASATLYAIWEAVAQAPSSHHRKSSGSASSQLANLEALGDTAAIAALKAEWPELFASAASPSSFMPTSVRDLELGMTGNDVLALQKLLNANGFPVAASGAGSASNETDYFGSLTKAALASYQAANGIAPAAGYFGTITRAQMKAAGVAGTWW